MKKIILAVTIFSILALPTSILAQDGKKKEKKSEEITIRNKGDKEMSMKVEIDGDKITINGKPLSEFKDENVTINKKKITINDGEKNMLLNLSDGGKGFHWDSDGEDEKSWGDKKAFLGVTTELKNDEKNGDIKSSGAKITNVTKASAAEKAGLKIGDIITKINDKEIDGPGLLAETVGSFSPKEEVTITYKRDGKQKTTKTILGEKKVSKTHSYSFSGPGGDMRTFRMPEMPQMDGEQMERLEELKNGLNSDIEMNGNFEMNNFFPKQKKLGLKIQDTEDGDNVKIIAVEDSSAAALAGLQKEDVITEIDGKKIANTDDAREQLVPEEGKKMYKMKILRNKQEMNIDVKIPRKLKTVNL